MSDSTTLVDVLRRLWDENRHRKVPTWERLNGSYKGSVKNMAEASHGEGAAKSWDGRKSMHLPTWERLGQPLQDTIIDTLDALQRLEDSKESNNRDAQRENKQ